MPAATFLHCDALDNHAVSCYNRFCFGGVSERFKEAVLKTVELLPGAVGSNPARSVFYFPWQCRMPCFKKFLKKLQKTLDIHPAPCYNGKVGTRRDGREAEGAPLLREYAGQTASWVQIPLSPFHMRQ